MTILKHINRKTLQLSAAATAGYLLTTGEAHAAAAAAGNDFSTIAANIIASIADLPGLLTGLSYMFGILLGVLGILKIKDHVENPSNTPLKDGAIRLAAGGALFALPIVFEAALVTIGDDGAGVTTATTAAIELGIDAGG